MSEGCGVGWREGKERREGGRKVGSEMEGGGEKGEEEREERGGKIGEGGGRVRRKAVTEVLS